VMWPALNDVSASTAEALEIEAKYAVYMERQTADAAALRKDEARSLPDLDFTSISGLSNELKAKLLARQPKTLGEAQRIEGMTPAALALLLLHAQRHQRAA
jgi:tRNA uridine 5-carboxymethylaminomethyl modification enzyme